MKLSALGLRDVRDASSRHVWLLMALALFVTGALLLYHFAREVTVEVGEVGDSARISGFYADEADLTYRYRWTRERAEVSFEGAGSASAWAVVVWAQAVLPKGSTSPVTMTAVMDNWGLGTINVSGEMKPYTFSPGGGDQYPSPSLDSTSSLIISSPTFRSPGDARDLGIKVDRVMLRQVDSGFNLPPVGLLLWGTLFIIGLYLLTAHMAAGARALAALLGAGALLAVIANIPLLAYSFLPPVATLLGVGGLLVAMRPLHRRWPEAVDAMGNARLARVVMLVALALYGVISLWTILNSDWIGHADYAENAVIARNLVQGRGLTVDYVAQFYKDYPGISHPAETWPLFQPLMIAPFFVLFGPETWAAKLPNLFVMLALAWVVFHVGSRLFNARIGLLAGLFTLSHPYFFTSVLYPINDLAFTLFFFALAWIVWSRFSPYATTGETQINDGLPRFQTRDMLVAGVLAGLLVWSKPSGAVLLLGVGIWLGWTWRKHYQRSEQKVPWRAVAILIGTVGLVLMPLFVRNMVTFGLPFYSTESYDASILRYWNGDQTLWERIYKVYVGGELPHPRWIIGGKFGYDTLFDAIGRNFGWVWQRGVMGAPGEGDYVFGLLPLAGALLGLGAATRRVGNLFGMVGLSLGLYALFVLGYWHFEGRYFQVIVPWLYLLLAWGLFWLWDRLRQRLGEGLGSYWGLLLLPVGVAALIWPNLDIIRKQIETDTRPTRFVATLNWIAANSSPADVVMTRDPWELNWHSGRRAVMIPFDDLSIIERIAERYGVTMMQLGGPVDRVDEARCPESQAAGGPYPTGSRPALGDLYCGVERQGYELVFKDGRGTIYMLEGLGP
ncbi:MAG: glycosyltransferase family 39 protein [Chloroflexia bacterium]